MDKTNKNNSEQRAYSMISLAFKAGKVVSGEDAVRNAIKYGKAKLLIISRDASDNTMKRFKNAAAYYHTNHFVWGDKEQLGHCIGKSSRSVIGINDENFSKGIAKFIEQPLEGGEIPGGELI